MAGVGRGRIRGGRSNGATASGDHYILPHHPAEIDRLDVQHYALLATIGAHYRAPIERPRRVLDVGSGSGQWGADMCTAFPDALVVGFDLQPGKDGQPANYRFVRGNLLQGLPFASNTFEFVHQRVLTTGVPLSCWAGVVDELVRVTTTGGWLELVELGWCASPAGPATERLVRLAGRVGRTLGLDTTEIVFRSLEQGLVRVGLTAVERRQYRLPIGEWGGPVGSLMATDIRAAFTRMCSVFEARGLLTVQESRELIGTAMAECERLRSRIALAVAIGRKSATAATAAV